MQIPSKSVKVLLKESLLEIRNWWNLSIKVTLFMIYLNSERHLISWCIWMTKIHDILDQCVHINEGYTPWKFGILITWILAFHDFCPTWIKLFQWYLHQIIVIFIVILSTFVISHMYFIKSLAQVWHTSLN